MLKLNAIFHRKEASLEPKSCVVEKIIPLTGFEFDRFSSNMLKDQSFIADNIDLMRVDQNGVYHCLLVTGEGRENGILIESEGLSYARYVAHVPHAHSVVASQNQSPALAEFSAKLSGLVDHLVDRYQTLREKDERVELPVFDEAESYGVDISGSDILYETATDMLCERLAKYDLDMELDKDELIITPREPRIELGNGPEQSLQM